MVAAMKDEPKTCFFWRPHLWTQFEHPQTVTNYQGEAELVQRRHCKRCEAVDYRRVLVHN